MEHVFFSFSFSEFDTYVDVASDRVNESPLLRSCGIQSQHLAKLEAFGASPLDNSLEHVRSAKYVVCLIGNSLGTVVKDDKTYLELEIEEALNADIERLFVFLVGEQYTEEWRTNGTVDPGVLSLVSELEKKITFGVIPYPTEDIVARKIVAAVENDVMKSFGQESDLEASDDPLNISGFTFSNSKWPARYVEELQVLYNLEHEEICSDLHEQITQRKRWIFKSLQFGHIQAAQNNIERVLEENGSDFFCCFWSARLLALYGNNADKYQLAYERAQRAIDIAREFDYQLIETLCLGYAANALTKCGKPEDLDQAQALLDKAVEIDDALFETRIFQAEVKLAQAKASQSLQDQRAYLAHGADIAFDVLRARLKYYLNTKPRLQESYGEHFAQMEQILTKKLYTTAAYMHADWSRNAQWATACFDLDIRQQPSPDPDAELLRHVYYARNIAWHNYRVLCRATDELYQRSLESEQQQKVDKQTHACSVALEKLTAEAEIACKPVTERPDHIRAVQEYTSYSNRLTLFSILSVLVIGMGALNIFYSLATGFLLLIPSALVLHITKDKRDQAAKQQRIISQDVEFQRRRIHGQLVDLVQTSVGTPLQPLLQDYIAKSTPQLEEFFAFSQQATQALNTELQRVLPPPMAGSMPLSQAMVELCRRIDQFENHSVSVHTGQYTQRISQKGRCQISFKHELGSDSFSGYLKGEKADSYWRCLSKNKNRLAAYTRAHQQAAPLFKALLEQATLEQTPVYGTESESSLEHFASGVASMPTSHQLAEEATYPIDESLSERQQQAS